MLGPQQHVVLIDQGQIAPGAEDLVQQGEPPTVGGGQEQGDHPVVLQHAAAGQGVIGQQ